ncbi:MAG: alpha amylase N-terminal ig-like domain-containing protein [Chloroflexia bacterium]
MFRQRWLAWLTLTCLLLSAFPPPFPSMAAPRPAPPAGPERDYGAPIAIDQAGDGNGNAVMDLLELYVAEDADAFYFRFTVNANIGATNWGKYALYLDLDGLPGSGATSDAWTRNVVAQDPHRPEYGIYTWVDVPPYDPSDTQIVHWTGTAWDWANVQQVDAVTLTTGPTSTIEWKVAKAKLGNPSGFFCEAWSTGGGSHDNAQDTVNFPAEDWNASDWSTTALLLVSTPYLSIDGQHEAVWGSPASTDPPGDMTEPNLDLHRLYLLENASYLYIGLDAYASNWGMTYGLYLDTDQIPNSGATTDPWGRAVNAVSEHLPEHTLYVWHEDNDTLQDAQLNHWNGSSWSYDSLISQGGAQGYGPAEDWLEYQVPKAALGSPSRIALEAFTTGSSGHAQDTVPPDPNVPYTVPDWGPEVTTLSAFYLFPPPTIFLQVTWPPEGHYFALPYIDVTGVVSPVVGVTVTVDVNGTARYTPTITPEGTFTQPVTLTRGSNTITVEATDGTSTRTVVRHVTFGASHDDDVFWDGLYHDSRDPAYRYPVGAVPAGTPVTIRLRAFANDLTAVRLRVWDDRADSQTIYPMSIVASDPAYDYWGITLTPDEPTVLWYRFIVIDGSDTDYYEDDQVVSGLYRGYNEGGPGRPYDDSPDLSFQLTVYDPAFHTPDWLKEAVVYQVFPDRFRDGDPTNNVISGTHFVYGNPNGGIEYPAWNSEVLDPRNPANPFYNRWNEDFYGGDLQGLTEKLEYLQSLGVTAIYLNPIFLSPSTHKYDTTSYEEVDPHLGGNPALGALLAEAQSRGIHVILDGVFNHTSSDSFYFDRYGRYPTLGAYESQSSPYYNWYTFYEWPNNYKSWWGYTSLPVLTSGDPEVRDYIYAGPNPIATRWIVSGTAGWRLDVAGDIDPGLTHDPTNDYWEGFRQAVKGANPEAAIIGEEWGDATPWLLGGEWDAVMNYRFRSALLSFLRDRHYEDNDNNASSWGGPLDPITPSQLDAWLRSIQEDYPPEAWQAMMNLLGSHDTNRVRFVLSKNQKGEDGQHLPYNPATDLSPEEVDVYQKLLALLQFTLPGAPTIYYGDEVGLASPGRWYNNKYEDDPYNRVPFPWEDTPGYYTRRSEVAERYLLLGQTRRARPALRLGSFDTLLTDDDHLLYAYGRKWGAGDAAVVLVNRGSQTYTVSLDVSGYLGEGTVFTDVLHAGQAYTVAGGLLQGPAIPPMDGALLLYAGGDLTPPAPPAHLTALEGEGQVILSWEAITDAVGYHLYRSLVSGGNYLRLASGLTETVYTDTAVVNGTWYYYVVTAVDASGNESAYSNEAAALPHYTIDWANLQWPYEITHTLGITPTENIYGQVWIDGVTQQPGPTPGLIAQVGFGPTSEPPISWTHWVDAVFNMDVGNNDEFMGNLLPEEVGEFYYLYRYSTTGGRDWVYADRSGIISPTGVVNPGLLHVLPSGDTTPPEAPQNLRVVHWGLDHITLQWDAVSAPDLYAYDLYRWGEGETISDAVRLERVPAPTTVYTDEAVLSNHTYTYTVQALDTSFNRSPCSNPASGRAVQRLVTLTLQVEVPAFTPAEDTVYVAGDNAAVFGASWDPGRLPLQRVDATHWSIVLSAPDGTALQYKYTRGNWDRVEKWGWLVGFANRVITPTYGATGAMTVTDTVYNWRDPLVVSVYPPAGATSFEVSRPITATFNRGLDPSTVNASSVLVNGGAVTGSVGYLSPTVYFTPARPLDPAGYYQVQLTTDIRDLEDGIALQRAYLWSFGRPPVPGYTVYLPLVLKNR